MILWCLSHRRPAKAQASLRIRAVSPEPSLFTHMKCGSRRRVRQKIKHLAPTGWLGMRVWRMSLRRTKSTIISWHGSIFFSALPLSAWERSRLMTKPTKSYVRPAKTQITLGICPVWSESSQCDRWLAEDPMFLHADSEDSDQTGRMPRLIWVVAGRNGHFVGFVMRRLSFDYGTPWRFFHWFLHHQSRL